MRVSLHKTTLLGFRQVFFQALNIYRHVIGKCKDRCIVVPTHVVADWLCATCHFCNLLQVLQKEGVVLVGHQRWQTCIFILIKQFNGFWSQFSLALPDDWCSPLYSCVCITGQFAGELCH